MGYADVAVKTYMKTKDAIRVAQEVFSAEPVISSVRATFSEVHEATNYIDITVVVEGDLYEGETRVLPLITEFMRRVQDVPVDFLVLPASLDGEERRGTLVYERD
jgi:hypothetical protein